MCDVSVIASRPRGVGSLYKVREFGNNLQEVFATFFQVFFGGKISSHRPDFARGFSARVTPASMVAGKASTLK